MAACLRCSRETDAGARFCAGCGAPLDSSATPTGTAPRGASPSPSSRPASSGGVTSSSTAVPSGRFAPGAVLAGRYRIVAQLGQGGMGEVYRADDLKLSQPVALKFLPEALQHDPGRLQRFYGEISLARQITHPAVCRVHDLEELDGQPFLTMEYVDGEDLAGLLRRIGRLPHDKALEIARQLCAGLAAAHDKGVLHRDLKPANVMLDGRGRARLTDFGLAALDETVSGAEARSGTPAYMSPEQLAGREATSRSDVYALGLVLYELFTGRRAFDGRTLDDLRRQHAEQAPESPSALVEGLDPAVERAILRCLEKDPRRRPSSALAVAAALPGGDPLAAALAAGETPSPELVAAAQRATRLRASTGWLALTVAALTLAATVALMRRSHVLQHLPPAKAPLVLEDRAHELLLQLAPQATALDAACGAQFDEDYFRSEAWRGADQGDAAWRGLRAGDPPVAQFWCRQGPAPLLPRDLDGQVGWADPPTLASDMAGVRLDLSGRLLSFYAVTPQRESPPETPPGEPDWTTLLAAARLDPAALRPVDPLWTPPFHTDRRAAWEGPFPARPDLTLRVEAAAYRGRPVFFRLVTPWTRAERMQPPGFTAGQRVAISFFLLLFTALLSAGVWLARRHLGSGRGDRRGAVRLAGATLLAGLASWALQTHYVADQLAQAELLARGLGGALLLPAVILVFYLALEPYARRIWPEMLISWTRLLSGGWRDQMVGLDVLLGAAMGGVIAMLVLGGLLLGQALGHQLARPYAAGLQLLLGLRFGLGRVLDQVLGSITFGLACVLFLVLLRLLLRRPWAAGLAFTLLLTLPRALVTEQPLWFALPFQALISAALVLLLLRLGLLAAVVSTTVADLLLAFPAVGELTGWKAPGTWFPAGVLAGLALYGFATARRGRSDWTG